MIKGFGFVSPRLEPHSLGTGGSQRSQGYRGIGPWRVHRIFGDWRSRVGETVEMKTTRTFDAEKSEKAERLGDGEKRGEVKKEGGLG